MKNIFLVPTDKPSRLHFTEQEELIFTPKYEKLDGVNIYITNDEEIKEEDWFITKGEVFKCTLSNEFIWRNNFDKFPSIKIECKKIILTTDQDLIQNGIQAIPDDFLEWFCQNSSCEFVEVVKDLRQIDQNNLVTRGSTALVEYYKLIIPQEEHKQRLKIDTCKHFSQETGCDLIDCPCEKEEILKGAKEKAKQERIFSKDGTESHELVILDLSELTKQETLEEAAEIFVNNRFTKQIKGEDIYASKSSIIESHILFAKWQKEQYTIEEQHVGHSIDELSKEYIKGFNEGSAFEKQQAEKHLYSEEDMKKYANYVSAHNKSNKWEFPLSPKEWFKQFKK